jgi:gas vesicle protein
VRDNEALVGTLVGALIGGAAGYFFFSESGRMRRRQLEPALDNFLRELSSFRGTIQKAAGAATEGWKLLSDVLGEPRQPTHRYPAGQTSPF